METRCLHFSLLRFKVEIKFQIHAELMRKRYQGVKLLCYCFELFLVDDPPNASKCEYKNTKTLSPPLNSFIIGNLVLSLVAKGRKLPTCETENIFLEKKKSQSSMAGQGECLKFFRFRRVKVGRRGKLCISISRHRLRLPTFF